MLFDYYSDLFSSKRRRDWGDLLSCVSNRINEEMNRNLTSMVTNEKIKRTVFQMGGFPRAKSGRFSWSIVPLAMECDWYKRDHCG